MFLLSLWFALVLSDHLALAHIFSRFHSLLLARSFSLLHILLILTFSKQSKSGIDGTICHHFQCASWAREKVLNRKIHIRTYFIFIYWNYFWIESVRVCIFVRVNIYVLCLCHCFRTFIFLLFNFAYESKHFHLILTLNFFFSLFVHGEY